MELLQTGIDTLSNTPAINQKYSVWFFIEAVIILVVIVRQFERSWMIYNNINQLKDIFEHPLKVKSGYVEKENLKRINDSINTIEFITENEKYSSSEKIPRKNSIKISIIETVGTNSIILRIRDAINTYLLNNYGAAVNFSIIKDFIDREVDAKDEEISNSLPTPLYLGLASTMIGIICGLFAVPTLSGGQFSTGIDALLNGVKIAMIGSLVGLACTTYLTSSSYKKAKKYLLKDKNQQISYLQATLLPELIKAEDTGVSGLKASLDRFAKVATDISDNVLIAANQTGENIQLQQEVIDKVSNLDIIKISETNLELFKRLEDNMVALQKFSEYLSSMNQISDNLKEFAFRTLDVNRIVNKIDTGLEENNRLSKFLTSHFEKIESAGNAARKAVDLADLTFKDSVDTLKEGTKNYVDQAIKEVNLSSSVFTSAIENLKEEINARISQLNRDATNNESKLKEIYSEVGAKLELITSQHLSQIQSAYSNAIPQFNQLNNLETLPKIQEQVSDGISKMQDESNVNTAKLIETINQLNSSLNNLKDNLSNNTIISKLDLIESQLKTNFSTRSAHNSPVETPKPLIGFWRRFRKQFRTKR